MDALPAFLSHCQAVGLDLLSWMGFGCGNLLTGATSNFQTIEVHFMPRTLKIAVAEHPCSSNCDLTATFEIPDCRVAGDCTPAFVEQIA